MNLSALPTITHKRKKRLGQGHGSGKVKTSGRGQKGQQARHNIPLFFEGGALPLIKRIPFLRGKDKNFAIKPQPIPLNLSQLAAFEKDAVIDMTALIKKGLVLEKEVKKRGVKILADGKLAVALVVKLPTSQGAKAKIEKAGGRVETTK